MDPRILQAIEECRLVVARGRTEVAAAGALLENARQNAKGANESLRRAEEALKQCQRAARLSNT